MLQRQRHYPYKPLVRVRALTEFHVAADPSSSSISGAGPSSSTTLDPSISSPSTGDCCSEDSLPFEYSAAAAWGTSTERDFVDARLLLSSSSRAFSQRGRR